MWLALLLGCPAHDSTCDEANARLGVIACVHRVRDEAEWRTIARPADPVDQESITKWARPYGPDSPLPETLFLNSNTYPLHYEMLGDAFPDRFPGLTLEDYSVMVLDPERKVLSSGNLALYDGPDGRFYGFTVWDDRTRPERTVTYDEVLDSWLDLNERFEPDELVFVPNTGLQAENAATWDAPFAVRGEGTVAYEPYTTGVGFGTVRRLDLVDLAEAEASASIGFQDLLILDEAPFDLAQPVSGTVTGTRQGDLSHLNVRAAARGTPNCFVPNALRVFEPWEGRLARLECGETGFTIREAALDEAEAFWASIRPAPVGLPTPDTTNDALVPLLALDTGTADARAAGVATYGSKGANLATLYQRIPADLQLQGFLVPFAPYARFLDDTWWLTDDSADGVLRLEPMSDTLERWHADPRFLAEPALRRARLGALRDAIDEAPVPQAETDRLAAQILDTFGSLTTMVRFRSSSNAEDSLAFSGAGLYDSTSVCAADSFDDDDVGPSLCDPDEPKERTIERGLRKVWQSVWSDAAWEERAWYGMDHTRVAMGVLVDTRAKDERINAVAFTGHPTLDDDRTLINAQIGTLDVVSAEPGVFPERILVGLDAGVVTEIVRVGGSSELPVGQDVMDDATVTQLAESLASIASVYPIDAVAPPGTTVLLDTEWKVLEDGRLIVKQVRPFARP
ncbi:MAG: PEP/pyruvate-binding domain-containing protein [Myxococcota bacterium]